MVVHSASGVMVELVAMPVMAAPVVVRSMPRERHRVATRSWMTSAWRLMTSRNLEASSPVRRGLLVFSEIWWFHHGCTQSGPGSETQSIYWHMLAEHILMDPGAPDAGAGSGIRGIMMPEPSRSPVAAVAVGKGWLLVVMGIGVWLIVVPSLCSCPSGDGEVGVASLVASGVVRSSS